MTIAAATLACASHRAIPLSDLPAVPCQNADRSAAPSATSAPPNAVRWYGPTQIYRPVELTHWCESVGPAVLQAPPSARADDGALDGLVVATWNIHGGAADLAAFIAYVHKSLAVAPGRGPHLVLLVQEAVRRGDAVPAKFPLTVAAPRRVGPSPPLNDIISVAREVGMWVAYVPSMRNGSARESGKREDRGSAVLSTLPLSGLTGIELPWVSQRRVAVLATVTGHRGSDSFSLTVASVHLDNRPNRAIQAEALASLLQSFTENASLIVGGDFNTWFGDDERTVRAVARVLPRVRGCNGPPTFRFRLHLDYLFASPSLHSDRRCEVAPYTFGSDHHPVWWRVF